MPKLRAEALCLEMDGETQLKSIDFTLDPTGVTVLMGPNGAGKSLLLRVLHGLIKPTSGRFHAGPPDHQAMVFQRPVLLRRSVEENLHFALRRARSSTSDESLKTSAKDHVRNILQRIGLASRAKQPARSLSGGEQQRLAMARALALKPRLLFLDEPTANLDPVATLAIEALVTEAAATGTKIILVTHDSGQARRLASDIVFMHKGRVVEHTLAEIFFDAPQSDEAKAHLAGRLVLQDPPC